MCVDTSGTSSFLQSPDNAVGWVPFSPTASEVWSDLPRVLSQGCPGSGLARFFPWVYPHSSLSPEGTWGWGLPSWCRALGLSDSTPTDSRLMGEQPGLGQEAWVLREGSALAPW